MKSTSLKLKVLIWFGGVVSIILILFSFSFSFFMNQTINENIKSHLHNDAIEILTDFKENNSLPPKEELYSQKVIILKNNKLIYNSKEFTKQDINKFINFNKKFKILSYKDNDDIIDAIYILKNNDYKVIVYKKDIDNKIENFEDILLTLNPLLLILLIFTASKLIDKILMPIKKITKTAEAISINNFSTNIEIPKEEDELKELVNSFNTMIKRLKSGVQNLNRFNNDVSHELKTPLTVIQGEIEITLRKLREPNEYKKSMKIISYEAKQMQSIIENLLLLTKYSPQNIEQSFELCQLDSMLLEIIDKFSIQIDEKRLKLHIKKIDIVSFNANKTLMYSIFSNLIDNAIKYTNNEKNIYISLYKKNKQIIFEIIDEGIGIETSKIANITDRFYRVDESRNKQIKGFGLGLSIVKNSVELHQGILSIKSKINKGTFIFISFS